MVGLTEVSKVKCEAYVRAGDNFGGITGVMSWKSTIERCSFKGAASRDHDMGNKIPSYGQSNNKTVSGTIAGQLLESELRNSYAMGTSARKQVIGKSSSATYVNCYATSGKTQYNGIDYFLESYPLGDSLQSIYFHTEKKHQTDYEKKVSQYYTDVKVPENKKLKALKKKSTYKGWDFKKIWAISKSKNEKNSISVFILSP